MSNGGYVGRKWKEWKADEEGERRKKVVVVVGFAAVVDDDSELKAVGKRIANIQM